MNLEQLKAVQQIISQLQSAGNRPVEVAGTWGSFAPVLAAHLHNHLKKPILYISSHLDDADNIADDISVFADKNIETLPGWAGEEFIDASDEISSIRSRLVLKISANKNTPHTPQYPQIITTSIQALMQPVQKPEGLIKQGLSLAVNSEVSMRQASQWLADNGFEPVGQIDMPGQFAKRGGIIDIFAPVTTFSSQPTAIRVEFFGDTIESIRQINLDTQRSSGHIENITITSPFGNAAGSEENKTQFLNLIAPETLIFIEEPNDVQETADVFIRRVEKPERLYRFKEIYGALESFKKVFISRFTGGSDNIELKIKSTSQYEHTKGPLWTGHRETLKQLADCAQAGWNVYMYCENAAEVKRVGEILHEDKILPAKNFHLPIGFIHHGFIIEDLKTIVVTHHELFGQSVVRRVIRPIGSAISVDSFAELKKGDYVVHLNYGIGKFKGIETIDKAGKKCEFITLQYADNAIIHVSAQNIALVQKYVGTAATRPKLNKIGTKQWEKQKRQVAAATADLAAELLETQAKRRSMGGIAFGIDTKWQKEFEESFPYQETPDQTTAAEQIKSDMQRPVPMDRLLCGDVGYGKTELAMRAAFKAIEAGKQVAVLVPTTVLCVQHERTFTQRFADFPISVESVNRFKTKSQAADIVKRAKAGKVDILIGTHRILSKDVGFKDLGLLIIDEEQRFGVEHKEKLKKIRVNVDVLTLTATPIPRTLHIAMLGLRDISSLATAPLDRRAVVTQVKKFDPELIKKAITLELNRQGQIFLVHNRVQTINKFTDEIKQILPDIKIAVAHGQMHKHELEKAMLNFVLGKIDILLCSAIIESGIDIPNANTIIVNDADRFGLAQLHQLRGRVGRFKHRAYAYFLLPRSRKVTPIAVKRLKAIEEYSQLGAGFKIALRDLEIRGAGNILGPEQSGHINTVGYELFCKLLSDAVRRLKNEPVEKDLLTVVDLGFSTYIPKNYIPTDSQRLNIYRQIASAKTVEDLKRITEQLADMFGPICDDVQSLIDIAEIRILAGSYDIRSINVAGNDIIFAFGADAGKDTAKIFAKSPGIVRIPDPATVHVRLDQKYFHPPTLLAVLRKLLCKNRV